MRIRELFEDASLRNGTFDNAIAKMVRGYRSGKTTEHDTCYAHVGSVLRSMNVNDAEIRFWGLKRSGLIVHGDAVLPDGKIISDIPVERYARSGYELVKTISMDDFVDHYT